VLLADPAVEGAGITADQVESALDPAASLGASQDFIDAALRAHASAVAGG
jgi:hypothetical protein